MQKTIKYTIENINGIQTVSDSFEINDNLRFVRITNKSLILKEQESSPILIITNFSINGIEVLYEKFLHPHWNHYSIFDLPISKLLKNTNDIKIEIKDNSKIEVFLCFEEPWRENSKYPQPLAYYIKK